MKKYLLLIIALNFCIFLSAQSMNVTGTVVTDRGYPVKNVKLSVLNLPISSKTNKDGRFTLKKVQPEDTIVVQVNKKSYVKFRLGENETLKLILSSEMLSLNQENASPIQIPFVMGTLYNNETRTMSVITAKMIERMNSLTIADALKGLVPGVNIQTGSSGEAIVTMRGNKSLNLSQNSLIIVDGMETTFDHANGISVHDVESIEISKDGFGYGVKGANGVVIIKTKKGG